MANATPQSKNVTSIKPLKSEIKSLVKIFQGLNYEQTQYIVKEARKALALKPDKKAAEKLPEILTEEEINKLIETASQENATHSAIIKLLYVTGLRVSELTAIKVKDVRWQECKIHIHQGKGSKDRVVLYPLAMKQEIRQSMFLNQGQKKNGESPLFQSKKYSAFSRSQIFRFIQKYGRNAGIKKKVHPHLLRHGHLTKLAEAGLGDASIQAQSGHSNKKILQRYIHLAGISRDLYENAIISKI